MLIFFVYDICLYLMLAFDLGTKVVHGFLSKFEEGGR